MNDPIVQSPWQRQISKTNRRSSAVAVLRVRDFGMKLNAEDLSRSDFPSRPSWCRVRAVTSNPGGGFENSDRRGSSRPCACHRAEQDGLIDIDLARAVFPLRCRLNASAEFLRRSAACRNRRREPECPDRTIAGSHAGASVLVNGIRAAGEDDAFRLAAFDVFERRVERNESRNRHSLRESCGRSIVCIVNQNRG